MSSRYAGPPGGFANGHIQHNKEGECAFCGVPLGWYTTKLIEVGGEGRLCCLDCDMKDFCGLPVEVQQRFVGYSDG